MESDESIEANVIGGFISVVACLSLFAIVIVRRDMLCYMLGAVTHLGLLAFWLSLLFTPIVAWQWGAGQLTGNDIKKDLKAYKIVAILLVWGLSSWLLVPIQYTKVRCEVYGVDKWSSGHNKLTPIYRFHCLEDAIEKAKELDKTRVEWARDDDGQFIEYDVELQFSERWPVLDGLNRLLGTLLGHHFWTLPLTDIEKYEMDSEIEPLTPKPAKPIQ